VPINPSIIKKKMCLSPFSFNWTTINPFNTCPRVFVFPSLTLVIFVTNLKQHLFFDSSVSSRRVFLSLYRVFLITAQVFPFNASFAVLKAFFLFPTKAKNRESMRRKQIFRKGTKFRTFFIFLFLDVYASSIMGFSKWAVREWEWK
jgi:hypothetical protein